MDPCLRVQDATILQKLGDDVLLLAVLFGGILDRLGHAQAVLLPVEAAGDGPIEDAG
jgi:hypothetical protein